MIQISDKEFEKIISDCIDSLPQDRIKGLQNVAITYANEPSPEQRQKLHLRGKETLFGLYEGIPLTKKAPASGLFAGTPIVLPDKITIFKKPILEMSSNIEQVKQEVCKTLWHEIGHYYGLDDEQIKKLEN